MGVLLKLDFVDPHVVAHDGLEGIDHTLEGPIALGSFAIALIEGCQSLVHVPLDVVGQLLTQSRLPRGCSTKSPVKKSKAGPPFSLCCTTARLKTAETRRRFTRTGL